MIVHPSDMGDAAAGRPAVLAEELGLLIDAATTYAIYMLDPQGRVTIWNRGAERIKGWTEAEIIGRDAAIFYPAEDVAAGKPRADLERAHAGGRIEEESWRVRKDGSEFLASVTITALHDDAGALRGFGKVIRDITDEKAAEAAILRREHHLRSILNTVPDAMIVMNEHGVIVSFSAAAALVFGYETDEVIGRNVAMLMPPANAAAHDAHLHTYRRTGVRHVIGNVRLEHGLRKNGEVFPIELAVGEASIAGERIFTGFIRDISQRQATERRLKELQAELVHVSRVSAMGTMASTLAHEINQPLTAIANYLAAARRGVAQQADQGGQSSAMLLEQITAAGEQSLRAGEIIRRMRDFAARHETDSRVEPVETAIREASALVLVGYERLDVTICYDLDPQADHMLADRIQIQQVLVNLLRNSLDALYTMPKDNRRIRVATRALDADWIEITVSDSGPGIADVILSQLYMPFTSTKGEAGMGIGLSICRRIVEAHGGSLRAENLAAGGAAFSFTVPRVVIKPGGKQR